MPLVNGAAATGGAACPFASVIASGTSGASHGEGMAGQPSGGTGEKPDALGNEQLKEDLVALPGNVTGWWRFYQCYWVNTKRVAGYGQTAGGTLPVLLGNFAPVKCLILVVGSIWRGTGQAIIECLLAGRNGGEGGILSPP